MQDVAEAYALWWRDAGLHSAVAPSPRPWLSREPVPANDAAPPPFEVAAPPTQVNVQVQPATPAPPPPAGVQAMPADLAGFRDWLANDPAQPEAAWLGPFFLPPARVSMPLLVLCDMPEDGAMPADDGTALPYAGGSARLVAAMLSAIGIGMDDVGFASLCTRRPPGGVIDDESFTALTERMRQYLALARPRAALVLGDRTSRALLAAHGGTRGLGLPQIHHVGGTVPAAAIAGPELLMRRPMAKAASWQALRLLHGTMTA